MCIFAPSTERRDMPILKENSLSYKLDMLPIGALIFLSDYPDYDVAYACRILTRKCQEGSFMKLAKGIYYKPEMTKFGPLLPSADKVVRAVARRDNAKVLPSGNAVLNQLGLSDQVPMRLVYLTSGSERDLEIGGTKIKLKRSVPKTFEFQGELMALLAQALKALGKDELTEQQKCVIGRLLKEHTDCGTFEHDLRLMPAWMQKEIKAITEKL